MEVVARRALPETPLPTAHDELGPVERAPALSFPSWMGRPDPPSICCCFRAMTPPPPQLRLAVGLSARQPVGWCPRNWVTPRRAQHPQTVPRGPAATQISCSFSKPLLQGCKSASRPSSAFGIRVLGGQQRIPFDPQHPLPVAASNSLNSQVPFILMVCASGTVAQRSEYCSV